MNRSQSNGSNLGLPSVVTFTFPERLAAPERDVYPDVFKNLAKSIRQQHPELSFDRLFHVIVSDDVWETTAALESMVGRELPAARNGAQSLPVFAVDVGEFDVMVYRVELINGFATGHPRKGDSIWHYLSTLAIINYYTTAKAKFSNDPWRAAASRVDLAMFDVASQLLAQYWAGHFSFHPQNFPAAPFEGLAEAVVEESKQIESAFTTNAHAANDEKLFTDLHASAVFLCGAMATAMGYCDAANYSLAEASPSTWLLIQQWHFEDVWLKMQPTIRMVFSDRHQWRNSTALLQLCEIPSYFLERTGVTFTSEDGSVPFHSVSLGMRGAH